MNEEELSVAVLSDVLTQFYIFAQKEEFQPSTLTNILYSMNKYHRDRHCTNYGKRVNLLKEIECEEVRCALQSKRVELKK